MLTVLDLGIRRAARLALLASGSPREQAPLSDLIVGIECGHSDSSSGVAANPVVGAAVDLLVDCGAAVILGETIEWLGAEHLLAKRAKTPELSRAIIDAVTAREQWARASGKSLTGNNPGEENIRGGLSTIEEKSLGAIAKSGSRPIESLIAVGERPSGPGLHAMDGPSFSPESLTGFAAAGAQVMLFTTGPGNSFTSAIAPTLKVTAQPATATRLREQIDFDAGNAFMGIESTEEAGARLVGALIEVCNGKLTWGEVLKEGLEVPTRILGSL
jgi:altronate dehydratase large subunit